ncbi:hypothetical protein [Protaetiibacter mangrovi]|uniref:DUF2975 domain-containing protein n=1 Tax=Protaetiibacter mangrovi TaxID=2970926 RepID=A0ABT1ZEQ1_9MICO|nr:hypothetical protein [Protaetiibacter mangrovi]MCS0499159.1 hypothetical protein [Protaetiibacter mangrovi]TPX04567.1 hypothetical protein FJ656_11195 [Schumannella luteola]
MTETTTTPSAPVETAARDPRRALVVAALVAGVLLLEVVVGFLESWAFSSQNVLFTTGVLLPRLLVGILPQTLGVFLVLWAWPARPGERIRMVLARALVAAFAGCLASVLAGIVYQVVSYGVAFSDLGALPYAPFGGFVTSVVALAPVVMLAALLQWAIGRGARV